jgi:hypothetical protein
MSKDLETLHIIELPSDNFEVRDARWSHGGSIIVLGTNGTGGEDTLLVYKSPSFEYNASYLPRESIPLVSIDAVGLLAGDNILAVAGRDVNGTSSMIMLETTSKNVRSTHNIFDNLTIQSIGNFELYLHAIDVQGGSTIFNTSNWNYEERIEPVVGPCQFSVIRTNLPITYGGVNGRLVVKEFFLLNQTVTFEVDIPPVQASTSIRNNYTSNVIVASPNDGGGSKIQVLHDYNGSFEVGPEIDFDATVTSMMLTPGESNQFGVGFSNGVFKLFKVSDMVLKHYEEPDPDPEPWPKSNDPERPYKEIINIAIGVIIYSIVAVSLWWFFKVRPKKKKP